MQTLDVISVNLWQIIASLANLVLLFFIVKRFLYKPVKKMLKDRQNSIDSEYSAAEDAKNEALKTKEDYEQKLSGAKTEAETVIKSAVNTAKARENEILDEAKFKADGIIRQAKEEAELEKKKATDDIKREIVEVSTKLTEKMLEREINTEDHKQLIDSFLEKIGDGDE